MKIEKVNNNQIKCFLSKGDLLQREIKVSELAYGTEKAQELFKDMMDQASSEFGFEVENVPLMIEAVPLSTDSIMLIITKVDNPEELEDKFTNFPMADTRKFRKKEHQSKDLEQKAKEASEGNVHFPSLLVYKFNHLDDITLVVPKLFSFPIENSSLYRNPGNQKYYLSILTSSIEHNSLKLIKGILSEYADLVPIRRATLNHFNEHYEVIIKDKALEVLMIL